MHEPEFSDIFNRCYNVCHKSYSRSLLIIVKCIGIIPFVLLCCSRSLLLFETVTLDTALSLLVVYCLSFIFNCIMFLYSLFVLRDPL